MDRVASANAYLGGGWDLAASTWYFYDDNTSPLQSPGSKGELTRVARLEVIDPGEVPGDPWPGCVHAYRASEVAYDYDAYGNRTTQTSYAGYGYMCQDSNWNVLDRSQDKEPTEPQITQTAYDSTFHAFPIQEINAAGHNTYWYYYGVNGTTPVPADGFFGALERGVDPNGAETKYRYDPFGRLTKVIRPGDDDDHPTLVYAYFDDDLEPAVPTMRATWRKHDPNATPWSTGGTWSREFFDGLGRLIQVQTPHQDWGGSGVGHEIVRFITYDDRGLKASESVAYEKDAYVYDPDCNGTGRTCNPYVEPDLNQPQTHYSYDPLGRVAQVTHPDGTKVRGYYRGWWKAVLDENDHQKVYENDAFGRLVKVREYEGTYPGGPNWDATPYATTEYAYDVLDNLTDVWDAANNHTQMEYDQLGRKVTMDDPDMGVWDYEYDAVGNLMSQTDARGCTINFTYDDLNRLTGKTYTGPGACGTTPAVSYAYDEPGHGSGIGRRTSMSDGSGSTSWVYDARGRVTQETKVINGAGSFTTAYTYYADDQIHTMTYPDNEVVTTTYNPMGLVKSVAGTSTYVGDTSYNALGQVDLRKLGSDVLRTDYVYFGASGNFRLQQLKAGTPSNPTSLQDLRYTYDAVGNVTRIEDWKAGSPEALDFSYDALDRLTGVSGAYAASYTYNEIGNITSWDDGVYMWYYYNSGKPHAVTTVGVPPWYIKGSYSYDANGNMTGRTVSGTSYTLTYDAENRLTQVSGGASASFVYDGDGHRVKATFDSSTTVYIGDYYEQTGTASTKYYYAGSQRIALRRSGYASDNGLFWLLTDHLGSTAVTAYSSGGRKAELRYKAYGETRYTDGTTPTAYKFTGQRLDESTGLYYYGARYYDHTLGRFVQSDTIVPNPGNPQDLNRYSYVRNNPLRYTDPSGRYVFEHEPDDPRVTPPRWPYPAMRSVSEPPELPVLGPALEILAQTPTGQPIVQFAMTHDINVWFGVGPFDTFGYGLTPRGTWIILPRALRSRSVMRQPGNVLLIAHELIHAMQNVARGSQGPPYSLYREVEAYIVQEVIVWEQASAGVPQFSLQQARKNLTKLSADLASAYDYVESLVPGYRTPLYYKEPTGDPAVTVGQFLNRPDFPAYLHDIVYGPQYGGLLAMVVQYLK